jgi:hypothetical protein
MSQAAVKPDGSDSPARKSCMFYKLMVASILQDKKLVNFNLLSCSVCLFGYRENEEKSSCVIIVFSSYLSTQNVEICLAFEKIAGVVVFQLESSFDYRRRLFYYPFFLLIANFA